MYAEFKTLVKQQTELDHVSKDNSHVYFSGTLKRRDFAILGLQVTFLVLLPVGIT